MGKGLRKLLGMNAVFGPAVASMTVLDIVGDNVVVHCLGSRVTGTKYWNVQDALNKLK